jgi:hypothetical protein
MLYIIKHKVQIGSVRHLINYLCDRFIKTGNLIVIELHVDCLLCKIYLDFCPCEPDFNVLPLLHYLVFLNCNKSSYILFLRRVIVS